MIFTEDNGNLTITVDSDEIEELRELSSDLESSFNSDRTMEDFFEDHLCNSEWEWILPEVNGDLTDAPILGVDGYYRRRYGFMAYEVRSPLEDLRDHGRAVFTGPSIKG